MRISKWILIWFGVVIGNHSMAAPNEYDVCESRCTYQSIQVAIQNAFPGDQIKVHSGVYHESEILIEKAVSIRGFGPTKPLVTADGKGGIFVVKASGVRIEGLRLANSGSASIRDIAAISLENADNCEIVNNELEDTTYGVYLSKSKSCFISENRITTRRKSAVDSGSGIHAWSSERLILFKNEIIGHRDGIYFEFVNDSRIMENFSHENIRYGLHFMFSHRNTYELNNFSRNEAGVAVMYSKDIRMAKNKFLDNIGPAAYGLLLKDISGSFIEENEFRGNTTGVFIEGTTRTQFKRNKFQGNGWAIKLISSSDQNKFYENIFLHNTFDLSALSGATLNVFEKNYWDRYEGLDLNRDGFGTIPYRPVRLSAIWMQTVDGAPLLMGSFFLQLMDQAERAFPSISSNNIVDEKPEMRPFQ